jgi:hypothetical protein
MIDGHDDISTLETLTRRLLQMEGSDLDALAGLIEERAAVVARLARRRDLAAGDAVRLRRALAGGALFGAKVQSWCGSWRRDIAECERNLQFADELRNVVPARNHRLNVAG